MPHPSEHAGRDRALAGDEAELLAEAMSAFATASRIRLLWAMLEGERTVDELAMEASLSPSAASHQLRLLRHGRLVAVRRAGRHAFYRLHDDHVAELLLAVRNHYEHVHPPTRGPLPPSGLRARAAREA
jgi:DNA-binding transcriptional ArsR family regulator